MEKVREANGLDRVPKPCEYFDMTGGTSTGGIMAIMLGRLSMTVDECICAYDRVAEIAFTLKPHLCVPPKGAYSARALKAAIKHTAKEFCTEEPCTTWGLMVDQRLRCVHMKTFYFAIRHALRRGVVLAIRKEQIDAPPYLFKTYDTSTSLQGCAIWQVARATSAATTFFKSIKLGRDNVEFIDAGFGYNNPCKVIISEARDQFPERNQVQVLSIALKGMATISNKVADELEREYGDSRQYYRFNVDRGLEDVTLSDWEKASKISAHTGSYLGEEKNQRAIRQFVKGFLGGPITRAAPEFGGRPRIRTCFQVPFPRNKRFVGRSATLARLKEMIFGSECQQAALDNKPEYSVFWLPALSKATFEQSYEEIARDLAIEKGPKDKDIKDSVQRYLSSEKAGKWFIIVDNADDMELLYGPSGGRGGIYQDLPRSENGLTLFTTRFRELAEMDPHEALRFLETSLDRRALAFDEAGAEELVRELTYLPLAIKQAVAYLDTAKLPISEYLGRLRSAEQDMTALMSKEFQDNFRYSNSQNAVATTWLVSFEQIRKFDPLAAQLLGFISRIEPKAIPQCILPGSQPEQQLTIAIDTLCAYAFLTRQNDRHMFNMHRLVHLGSRIWIQRHGSTAQITCDAIIHLEKMLSPKTRKSIPRAYLPHALRLLHESSEHNFQERSDLCYCVGRCLLDDRRYKESIWALEERWHWSTKRLADDHPRRLDLEHDLASTYIQDRRIKEAIQLLEHIVAIREGAPKEDDRDRLASEHQLARAYLEDQQIKEAIAMFERIVTVQKEQLAEDDYDRLVSEHELARAYLRDGQAQRAIQLLEHVVAVQEVLPEDYEQLKSAHMLATAYLGNNQVEEAVQLLEHVVTVQRMPPENDKYQLRSEHTLARAYLKELYYLRCV
ncbi:acyl transferase/acyl hydrolase/lysophospholipase [Hypoxylon crocopeplum]|nr:acyl transferase/acyl hydrolase/lysophospholipase [Hypoxylon crocopeplum]